MDDVAQATNRLDSGAFGWVGGKSLRAPWLLPLIPYTRIYCEAYGGAGAILFSRRPSPVEVFNDLDGFIVNFFRVLQDEELGEKLIRRLELTVYSRREFEDAILVLAASKYPEEPDLALAHAFFVVQGQGSGGLPLVDRGSWGRAFTGKKMAVTTAKWWTRVNELERFHWRARGVQFDHRDALEFIPYWDTPDTTFYLDPPYLDETRVTQQIYREETDYEHHVELIQMLPTLQGAVILSGYDNDLYASLPEDWEKLSATTSANVALRTRTSGMQGLGGATDKAPRTDCVWRNPRARLLTQPSLFDGGI